MARLQNISKYWVVRLPFALTSSNVYSIDMPSMGFCLMPLTTFGSGNLHASRMVGPRSVTWWNGVRVSRLALMPWGQWTPIGFRVPPKCDATCLVHWNGAHIAHAQPRGTCGSLVGPPISAMRLM